MPNKSTHNHPLPPPPPPLYNPFGYLPPPNSGYYNPQSWFLPPPNSFIPPPQQSSFLPSPYPYTQFQTLPPPPPPPCCSIPQSLKDSILRRMILLEIEHYFSDDYLARDVHLKENMDDNGWLPITFIASFERVSKLTNDIPFILYILRLDSKRVEVEGHKVRRRDNWKKWIRYKINMVPNEEVSSTEACC